MPSLIILGANGFLGRCLVNLAKPGMSIKAVSRKTPAVGGRHEEVSWLAVDLLDSGALDAVLEPGDVVINLAYMPSADHIQNVRLIDNVIEACHRKRVSRLIHCSTAVVAGATSSLVVDETTPCQPATPYERTKYCLEERVLSASSRGLDVAILRPTAIVGPGGQNLLMLAESLKHGSRWVNYLRASLFGRRPMHLVPVRDVVAALIHLATMSGSLAGNVYIVSSDDDPDNNFLAVESILSGALGVGSRSIPPLPLPKVMLSLLHKLLGRSGNLQRYYDSSKLRATQFRPQTSVHEAVCEFAESLTTVRQ